MYISVSFLCITNINKNQDRCNKGYAFVIAKFFLL